MNSCSGDSESGSSYDTTFLESGVKYIYLEKGDGLQIDSLSHVSVHINLIVGQDTIWSTYSEGEQIMEFDAKRTSLIDGFDEVVMYAREGDRILAIIPPELGYGDQGSGDVVPPNATLQFDLNMLKVEAPKIFLSDILHPIYLESGIEEMITQFQALELDDNTHNLRISEWYDLSTKLLRSGQFQDAVELWDFKLKESTDLTGCYLQAQAFDRLGQQENAITALTKGLKEAADTTGSGFVRGYLAELKSR